MPIICHNRSTGHLPGIAAIALILAGCGPAVQLSGTSPGAQTAYFAEYPEGLFSAAVTACDAPGQSVLRPAQATVVCETLPSPESAAALILAHDGTVEALPSYIIGFQAVASDEGYLVIADTYIRVPQADGTVAQVRLRDEIVEETVRALLISAGGAPVTP